MDINRVQAVLSNKEKTDIFYDDRAVWIQELNNDTAGCLLNFFFDMINQIIGIMNLEENKR